MKISIINLNCLTNFMLHVLNKLVSISSLLKNHSQKDMKRLLIIIWSLTSGSMTLQMVCMLNISSCFITRKNCYRYGFLYTYNEVYWVKDESKKLSSLSSKIDKEFKEHIVRKAFSIRSKK